MGGFGLTAQTAIHVMLIGGPEGSISHDVFRNPPFHEFMLQTLVHRFSSIS
jgi:hypothetical protein